MTMRAPWTEPWQQVTSAIREQFWGDLAQPTWQRRQDLVGQRSLETRDRYLGVREYARSPDRADARNGFYDRDGVTCVGTLRVRVARTRQRAFLPAGLVRVERRAAEVLRLIREAVLRGRSPRAVGRVIALITEEPVRAQTLSRRTRNLGPAVAQVHQAPLTDDGRSLFLDGVSLRVRRPGGRKRVQLLVAYGVRDHGTRPLRAFTRSTGECQAAWEGRRMDLYRRGLEGRQRHLVMTDGCAGLAAALQTVYPRVAHQRGWGHTLRNLLSTARRRDHAAMKTDAQAIDQAASRAEAVAQAPAFARRWREPSPQLVTRLLRDLPEWLACFQCPRALWRKLRTTNVLERCFVDVRRRTRPMVYFMNVPSVERMICSIFNRFNPKWRQRTLRQLTQVA